MNIALSTSKTLLLISLIFISNASWSHTIPQTLEAYNTIYSDAYDLIIPENDQNIKLPLYIILPGGVGKKKYTNFRDQFIRPSINDKGLIFSPTISWKNCNAKKLEEAITSFISVATNTMNVDPNKIIIVGYSNGGMQGLQLAKDNAPLFSNLVLISSTFKITDTLTTPIHIIHGTRDRYFSIRKAQRAADKATALGCDITFVAAQGKTDYKAAQYIPELSAYVSQF